MCLCFPEPKVGLTLNSWSFSLSRATFRHLIELDGQYEMKKRNASAKELVAVPWNAAGYELLGLQNELGKRNSQLTSAHHSRNAVDLVT